MTHDSETSYREALAERALCVALSQLRTPEEIRAFLRDLCTAAERGAMADRWIVVEQLKEALPHGTIRRLTGVSLATIKRVAESLASGHGGYDTALRRVDERRRAIAAVDLAPRTAGGCIHGDVTPSQDPTSFPGAEAAGGTRLARRSPA